MCCVSKCETRFISIVLKPLKVVVVVVVIIGPKKFDPKILKKTLGLKVLDPKKVCPPKVLVQIIKVQKYLGQKKIWGSKEILSPTNFGYKFLGKMIRHTDAGQRIGFIECQTECEVILIISNCVRNIFKKIWNDSLKFFFINLQIHLH